MPLVADYLVFSDRLRSLQRGEDIDVSYQRELDVTPAQAGQILAYKAASGSPVTFRVSLNGREMEVHEFLERENWRTLHEVLPSGSLRQGLNTLTVRITARGEEQLLVSDFVVWFKKEV